MKINKTPRFIFDNSKGKDMDAGFTLLVCFSRRWCVHNFFTHFNKLKIPLERCHLLIFDNSDNILLTNELKKRIELYKDAFYTTRLYKSFRTGGSLRSLQLKGTYQKSKLPKIYAMHRDFLRLIKTDVFVMLEDDTLVPPNCVIRMLKLLKEDDTVGIVTGIETGRSTAKHVPTRLGVHYILKKGDFLLERLTPRPNLRGVIEVDACGWYCCASYVKLWKKGFKGMSKYLRTMPRFALDNYQTSNIHDLGYKILADFNIQCTHMNIAQDKIIMWTRKDAVAMVDVWVPKYNNYGQGIWLEKNQDKKYIKWYQKPKKS